MKRSQCTILSAKYFICNFYMQFVFLHAIFFYIILYVKNGLKMKCLCILIYVLKYYNSFYGKIVFISKGFSCRIIIVNKSKYISQLKKNIWTKSKELFKNLKKAFMHACLSKQSLLNKMDYNWQIWSKDTTRNFWKNFKSFF